MTRDRQQITTANTLAITGTGGVSTAMLRRYRRAKRFSEVQTERTIRAHQRFARKHPTELPRDFGTTFYEMRSQPKTGRMHAQIEAENAYEPSRPYMGRKGAGKRVGPRAGASHLLQVSFRDEAGKPFGAAGVTVTPQGRAHVGGVPEKFIWTEQHLGPRDMRGIMSSLKQQHPEIKQFVGIHSVPPKTEERAKKIFGIEGKWRSWASGEKGQVRQKAARAIERPKQFVREMALKHLYGKHAQAIDVVKGAEKLAKPTGAEVYASKLGFDPFTGEPPKLPANRWMRKIPHGKLGGAMLLGAAVTEVLRRRKKKAQTA